MDFPDLGHGFRGITSGVTTMLPGVADLLAPDGSEVRVLLSLESGGMAHFLLRPGQVSRAVRHRTVEEIWYVLSGRGEMWRAGLEDESVIVLSTGVCLTIPVGVGFQFRCIGNDPLAVLAVTMPPWPGESEAEIIAGAWPPAV